jgi:hypothetical protein
MSTSIGLDIMGIWTFSLQTRTACGNPDIGSATTSLQPENEPLYPESLDANFSIPAMMVLGCLPCLPKLELSVCRNNSCVFLFWLLSRIPVQRRPVHLGPSPHPAGTHAGTPRAKEGRGPRASTTVGQGTGPRSWNSIKCAMILRGILLLSEVGTHRCRKLQPSLYRQHPACPRRSLILARQQEHASATDPTVLPS